MREQLDEISNIFLKLAHAELLLSYSTDELVSLIKTTPESGKKVLDYVWQEDGSVPLWVNKKIINGLTQWLFSKGENPDAFADRMFSQYKNLYSIPKRSIIRSYLPFVPLFYDAQDQRHLFLELLEKRRPLGERYQVFCHCKENDSLRRDFVAIFSDFGKNDAIYSHWVLKSLKYGPLYMGLPAFENVKVHSAMYSAEEALVNRKQGHVENKSFIVNGSVVGPVVPFEECVHALGIDFDTPEFLSRECIRADVNVIDELTGCVLLSQGCFYGAPVGISEFTYEAGQKVKDPFAKLMSALVKDEFVVWGPIQKAHEALLHQVNHVADVVYYESDDSIAINGKHLMRNVPARILRNVLREYTKTGREEFENREFKRDPEICIDALNPNFESRLNRVVDHLQKVSDVISLDRHRRGGFRLVPHCHIDFREEGLQEKSKK